jgi:pimeloyl-ACP methyl ester carboxylesterase
MNHGEPASHTLPDGRTIDYHDSGDPTGRPIMFQPGTPNTRIMGRLWHPAAHATGTRLISISRPGYEGSTATTGRPTLSTPGRDTADLATLLHLDEYAVLGSSGGAPFAAATAATDPHRVRALGILAGTGPWRDLTDTTAEPEERACLALLDDGDLTGARAGMRHLIENIRQADLRELPAHARLDAWLTGDPQATDPTYRATMADALHAILNSTEGAVTDALALGAGWDIDPRHIQAPTLLWYGAADHTCPATHAHWYTERIPDTELVIFDDEDHLTVGDSHRPEILAALLNAWR